MEILLTGCLKCFSRSFVETAERFGCRVCVSSDCLSADLLALPRTEKLTALDKDFKKILSTHSFDGAVFVANRPEAGAADLGELKKLDEFFRFCVQFGIKKIILISSMYIYNDVFVTDSALGDVNLKLADGGLCDEASIALYSAEQLCGAYRKRHGLSVSVLRVPWLWGNKETFSPVGSLVFQVIKENKITVPSEASGEKIDFLAEDDLAQLIFRIFDDEESMHLYPELNVNGKTQMTAEELCTLVKAGAENSDVALQSGATNSFKTEYAGIDFKAYPYVEFSDANRVYQWQPVHSLDNVSILEIFSQLTEKKPRRKKDRLKKLRAVLRSKSIFIKILEIVLGFVAMQLLNKMSDTTTQFQYIDFRLLYIVLISNTHGFVCGIISAVLACISFLIAFLQGGTDWRFLIYDVNNWLPFACYILLGCIVGYIRDKRANDLKYMTEEKENIDDRYRFLNRMYNSALTSRNDYKNQIMSYRNSFGRFFDVVHNLSFNIPNIIFYQAIVSLEDITDNQSVFICRIDGDSGKLMAASKGMEGVPYTLDLQLYQAMLDELTEGEVWANTAMLDTVPDICFPVCGADKKPLFLICIQNAPSSQTAIYSENIFKIYCSMISDALIRSTDENKADFIPDTKIYNKEIFAKQTAVYRQLADEHRIECRFFKVAANDGNIKEMWKICAAACVRATDVFGQEEDGSLGIIIVGDDAEAKAEIESMKTGFSKYLHAR